MIFPDVAKALAEMARVTRADDTVGGPMWHRREAQPAYVPFIDAASRHA